MPALKGIADMGGFNNEMSKHIWLLLRIYVDMPFKKQKALRYLKV